MSKQGRSREMLDAEASPELRNLEAQADVLGQAAIRRRIGCVVTFVFPQPENEQGMIEAMGASVLIYAPLPVKMIVGETSVRAIVSRLERLAEQAESENP